MSPADVLLSKDKRNEVFPNGAIKPVEHDTEVVLTRGLSRLRIAGKRAGVVGSSGVNRSNDHAQAKEGRALVPLPPRAIVQVATGADRFRVGGNPVAVKSSKFRVPDVQEAEKTDMVDPAATAFRVAGEEVVRGEG